MRGTESSTAPSFPVKCCYSHWDQTFTPPPLSANPSPSVPLVRHQHRADDLFIYFLAATWYFVDRSQEFLIRAYSSASHDLHNVTDAICVTPDQKQSIKKMCQDVNPHSAHLEIPITNVPITKDSRAQIDVVGSKEYKSIHR